MTKIARLNQAGTAVEAYPLSIEDVQRERPDRGWPTEPTAATFAGTRYVLVEETPPPEPGFGAYVQEVMPQSIDGTWRQSWQIVPPDLATLKADTKKRANLAATDKISTLELARGLDAGAIRPRTQAILDKLDDVLVRLDAATTAAEVGAILAELENF